MAGVVVTAANMGAVGAVSGDAVDLSARGVVALARLPPGARRLDVSRNPQLARLTGLEALSKSLTWLDASDCGLTGVGVSDVRGLAALSFLSLAGNSGLAALPAGALAGLGSLKALLLNGCALRSLRGLAGLGQLNTLVASHNPRLT